VKVDFFFKKKLYLRCEEVVDPVGVRGHEDLDPKALRQVKHQVDEALLELIVEQSFWLYSRKRVSVDSSARKALAKLLVMPGRNAVPRLR
jgi:hypothetical protein